MNKNPLISVIVPVYNAEKYIDRCIESILTQTYPYYEIILVNDGSSDYSLFLLKQYERDYKNIKVFTQKNQGPGMARNLGIKKSKGEYITFVDSDDYIEDDYLKNLISEIGDCDISLCGYKRLDQNLNPIDQKVPCGKPIDLFKFVSTCCKLYKRKLLVDNHVLFPKERIGEDICFSLLCYSYVNKVKYVTKCNYVIVTNLESLTHTIGNKNKAELFSLIRKLDKKVSFEKYEELYLHFYLKTLIMNMLIQPKSMKWSEYYHLYETSFSWLEEKYHKNNTKIKLRWQKNEEKKVNLCINVFIILRKIHLIKPFLYLIKKIKFKI